MVKAASGDSMVFRLPESKEYKPEHACVMVTYTHLASDIFAPHLMEFTRTIVRSYSDIPLAVKAHWIARLLSYSAMQP